MDTITKHFSQVNEGMTLVDRDEVGRLVSVLKAVREQGGTVWLVGNGGSHSTAGHFANDLLKMCHVKAVCVGDMGATVLAHGNDNGWPMMFDGIVKKLVRSGDCVIGISCSGNSENVIWPLRYAATEKGVFSAGMTGMENSSTINKIGLNALVHTPGVPDIRVQEDLHLMICHAVVRILQEER